MITINKVHFGTDTLGWRSDKQNLPFEIIARKTVVFVIIWRLFCTVPHVLGERERELLLEHGTIDIVYTHTIG